MDLLSRIIEERGWAKASIGVEMDNYWFTAAAFASLTRHLPNARFKDATALVNWQRAVKSSDGDRLHAPGRPHRRGDARRASSRKSSRACASPTSSPRSTTPGSAASRAMAATIRPSCRCCLPARTLPRRISPGTTSRCGAGRGRSSRSPAATSATIARSRVRSSSASRRRPSSMPRRRRWKAWRRGSPPQNRATPVRISPTPSSACSSATASSRTTERAIRSASAIRPTGASGR